MMVGRVPSEPGSRPTDQAPAGLGAPSRGPWLCFHCGEAFYDKGCARLHFGADENSVAACVIKAGAEGSLLRALRDAEAQAEQAWSILHSESGDFAKAWHSMRSRNSQALIAAEELGYERGLADGAAWLCRLEETLKRRSLPTMDPPWSAAFNAALDMVERALRDSDGSREAGETACGLDAKHDSAGLTEGKASPNV